jgi:hypothetical protein
MKLLTRTAVATAAMAVLVSALVMVPGQALASTISFNDAFVVSLNPDSYTAYLSGAPTPYVKNDVQQTGTPPALATTTQTVSSPSTWGSTSGSASANLATAVLGGAASATYTGSGSPEVYAQTNASFGDGFRTTTTSGQPFTWTPTNGTAQFNFTVDGSLTASPESLDATNGGAFILLQLYQPGTLNPNNAYGIQPNDIGTPYLFLLGNPSQNLEFCDQAGDPDSCEILTPTASYTDLSQTINITQTINPGGDFDWLVLLGADGSLNVPGSFNFDFSHTVTVGYQGPAGTTTTSVSGEFDNFASTSPVPEPGTLLLLGSGAFGLLTRRNRRKAN